MRLRCRRVAARLRNLGWGAPHGVITAFLLAGAALAVLLVIWSPSARTADAQGAAQTWEVQVGAVEPAPGGSLEAMAYLPDPLTIRVGDTVQWRFAGLHTVTFPSGKVLPPRNMPGPGPGEVTLGPLNFPSGPASYDGTEVANSGRPFVPPEEFGYKLTFTRPGRFGYVCLLHPGMRGEIQVMPATVPLPETAAEARARGLAAAGALMDKIKADARTIRPTGAGGVHAALAGLGDGFGASALQFLPTDVAVHRGDTVVWTLADPFVVHTITFTSGAAPPDLIEPRPQPTGPPLLVQPAIASSPFGGAVYEGQGLVNSGVLAAGRAYILRFDAPAGTYAYLCLVHPEMQGTITVTE